MNYYVKTMLSAYRSIPRIQAEIDELIKEKSLICYAQNQSTHELFDGIINLIHQKNLMGDLKALIDGTLKNLEDEEKKLIDHKYFKRQNFQNDLFNFCERTYFRKQHKVAREIEYYLTSRGFTSEWFNNNFGDMNWIKSINNRILCEEEKNKKSAVKKPKLISLGCISA